MKSRWQRSSKQVGIDLDGGGTKRARNWSGGQRDADSPPPPLGIAIRLSTLYPQPGSFRNNDRLRTVTLEMNIGVRAPIKEPASALSKNYMPEQKLKITFYNTVEMHVGEYDSKRNAGYKIIRLKVFNNDCPVETIVRMSSSQMNSTDGSSERVYYR
ncbi:hypothetical protein EAG_01221 [Camponotus floridanus]|uniref:Uncharacterized protein n=1 Tax=Camponotus floridanus TaxID=104421 RepID=E2AD56_CAMFO|nr:hypothetical protein EAG_01221 [Camponotus floridanus]